MVLLARLFPLARIALRAWRRLPASQRRRLLLAARRHGPRLATGLARRRRLLR